MTFEFRKVVVPDEIEALCAFDKKAFADFPSDLFSSEEWTQFESHWMIVDGVVIGCSAVVQHQDYDEQPKLGSLWIASTGIVPEHRRKGFGQILKEWQIEHARKLGFKVIVTNMRQSNDPIVRLNRKLGFVVREYSRAYYSEPTEDAIVMELRL